MKIIAIRGRNLASLAGEFAVDFASEPLASAGLYAITGPTGAGKSTLLDALCVALYERTPRLARASTRSEAIPDVGDSGVAPSDPRTLLRRGAGEGYAEVDFVGGDGVAYRARWSVRRARNRAEGKLQASEVTFERIEDRQQIGDHRKSETLRLIESKIGLNFEQFTRAVLLAQNDFATFLKASDDERAELLQTLTGTGTFAELSKLAYTRMKTEKEALDRLRTQLADQAPIAAEVRAEKEAAVRQGAAQQQALDAAKARCEALLRWHEQLGKLKASVEEAAQRHVAALVARAAAADRTRRLALCEAVEPARPLAAEVDRLEQEIAVAVKSLAGSEQQAQAARLATGRLLAAVDAAGQQLAGAEQTRSASLPQIEAARTLDAQIEAQAPQHAAAVKAADEAKREYTAALAKREATQSQLQAAQAELNESQRWLERNARISALAEGWQRWETLLAQAAAQNGEGRRLTVQVGGLVEREARIAAQWQRAAAQHAQQAAAMQIARTELAQRTQAWQAFDGDEMLRRKQRLDLRRDQLSSASALWTALGEQRQRLAEVDTAKQEGTATVARCTSTLAALDLRRPRLEFEYAAALRALELAQQAASASAESLRALLQDGAPCPVCGGVDHPYAQHDPRANAMLAALAGNVETARKDLAAIDAQRAACHTESEGASRQFARLEVEATAIASAIAERERGWAAIALREELASVADEARAAWFAGQLATLNAALQQLHGDEEAWRAAIRQRDAAQAALDLTQQALDVAQGALARGENEQTATRQALAHARQQLAASEAQLAASLAVLDGAFAEQDWRTRWLASPEDFVSRCRSDAEAWTARSRQVGESSARIATLSVTLASQAEVCTRAAAASQASAERLAQIDGERQVRGRERHALLGGRAVKEVEAALEQAVDAARQSLGQQQSQWQQANAEQARADEAQRQAAALLRQRQDDSGAARQRLAAWLSAFSAARGAEGGEESGTEGGTEACEPLAPEALAALLAVGADWQREERARLQAIAQAVDSAQAVCEAQKKALAAQLAARPADDPETTADAVAATLDEAVVDEAADAERASEALARIRVDIGTLADRLGNLRAELAADDARREKTRALGETIVKQESVAHVWSQLGELIGSADGKKFRNFAQQLTLDILLGYGNRQLENLSRRYRLERVKDGLGLLVVDQEMGDEVRSVHTLSGGESFLVSLALALGLASLSSHRVRVESLFIDEGFGSLDADSLRVAMDALDALQAQGRKVGVISHVAEMTERISVRVQVKRLAGGQSRVSVV